MKDRLDMSNALDGVVVAAGNAYNDSSPVWVKDIRAAAVGTVNLVTHEGNAVAFPCLEGERLQFQGHVEIVDTTDVDVLVWIQEKTYTVAP